MCLFWFMPWLHPFLVISCLLIILICSVSPYFFTQYIYSNIFTPLIHFNVNYPCSFHLNSLNQALFLVLYFPVFCVFTLASQCSFADLPTSACWLDFILTLFWIVSYSILLLKMFSTCTCTHLHDSKGVMWPVSLNVGKYKRDHYKATIVLFYSFINSVIEWIIITLTDLNNHICECSKTVFF